MSTSTPYQQPTQEHVDSLAAFIEAADELQNEPFFGPDEKRVLGHNGHNYYCEFGDRFHFRSALVSFRRIWLTEEASNFYRIVSMLNRFEREQPTAIIWLPMIRNEHDRIENSPAMYLPELTTKQLVDLWLNSVFAHNNISQKRKNPKRFDRADFDRYAAKVDYAFFENAFRTSIFSLGLCYRNLLKLVALPTLERWGAVFSLTPSFQIGAPFGRGIIEVTKGGVKIGRSASTQYWNPETPEQRLWRFLSRREFEKLGKILNQLNLANIANLVASSQTYREMLDRADCEIVIVQKINLNEARQDMAARRAVAIIPCGSLTPPDPYSVVYVTRKIVMEERAAAFWSDNFIRLKNALRDEAGPTCC